MVLSTLCPSMVQWQWSWYLSDLKSGYYIILMFPGLVAFRLKGDNTLTERLLKRLNGRGNMHAVPACFKGIYVIRFTVTSERTTNQDILGMLKVYFFWVFRVFHSKFGICSMFYLHHSKPSIILLLFYSLRQKPFLEALALKESLNLINDTDVFSLVILNLDFWDGFRPKICRKNSVTCGRTAIDSILINPYWIRLSFLVVIHVSESCTIYIYIYINQSTYLTSTGIFPSPLYHIGSHHNNRLEQIKQVMTLQ